MTWLLPQLDELLTGQLQLPFLPLLRERVPGSPNGHGWILAARQITAQEPQSEP